MRSLPAINEQLAAAVRKVNAAFYAIPENVRPDPAGWDGLDREVDAACAARDRERALAAIAAWEGHWLSTFSRCLLNAPLEGRAA